MAPTLGFAAAQGVLGLSSQADAIGFLQKTPVSLLETLSSVELQVGSSSAPAWVLVFMSVLIIVLLGLLVLSDASHRPFEVVQPGTVPQYRLQAKPVPPPLRATLREPERGRLDPDRPVPAGVPVGTGGFEGPRPVPPDRPKPAQYSSVAGYQPAQPMVVAQPAPEERGEVIALPPEQGGPISPVGAPHLCPQLALPTKSCFVIPVEKLMEGVGSFAVLGLSGVSLLRATIKQEAGNRRTIEVTMGSHQRSPVLASIGTPLVPGPGLEVRGAQDRHFGWLRPGPTGGYVLQADNLELLSMFCVGEGYKLFAPGGEAGERVRVIAQADRNPEFEGTEHLQVTVYPQVDAVLVICCVLAAAVFGGGDALPALEQVD